MTDEATLAQLRVMATQAAEIALSKMMATLPIALPKDEKVEIPAMMKWAGGIITALVTAGVIALCFWLVSSVNDMQQTLARMDERQKAQTEGLDGRFADYDRRIRRLETYHQLEGGKEP